MKYNLAPYSPPPRSVLCQYNDHRWDVSHRHSGGSAVSSPRSKWRKHAEMGELRVFIKASSVLSVTYIMLSCWLCPVNGWFPCFRYDINLYFTSSLVSRSDILNNTSSICQCYLCSSASFLSLFILRLPRL